VIELALRAFLTLAGDRTRAEQARIARRAVVVAGAVLFFFALGGPWLLGSLIAPGRASKDRVLPGEGA
jgi:small neutral amino acid transporter SnatA (MarC family)